MRRRAWSLGIDRIKTHAELGGGMSKLGLGNEIMKKIFCND